MYEDILVIRKDEYQRNRFIEKYKPFLAKYTSSICNRYVAYGVDDELSIALLAFNESIDRYNGEGIFFEYAKMIVRSRLYDYFNSKEYKESHLNVDLENNEIYHSKEKYSEQLRQTQLKQEVEDLEKLLGFYEISMNDLYTCRPKHLLNKNHVDHLISLILKNDEIVSLIIDKGQIPITRLTHEFNTTKKRVEPYRKYMIAVILICVGQFDLLKDYMPRKVMNV